MSAFIFSLNSVDENNNHTVLSTFLYFGDVDSLAVELKRAAKNVDIHAVIRAPEVGDSSIYLNWNTVKDHGLYIYPVAAQTINHRVLGASRDTNNEHVISELIALVSLASKLVPTSFSAEHNEQDFDFPLSHKFETKRCENGKNYCRVTILSGAGLGEASLWQPSEELAFSTLQQNIKGDN